jgi:outer membrane protein OmpA-like peptidoglycan-associated protein
MRQTIVVLMFVALIAALGALAAFPVGVAAAPWIGERTGVAARVAETLGSRARTSLADTGLDWASVDMDGQVAVLTGEAPREEERAEAIAALLASAGAGGWLRGGVVAVRDLTTLAPPISPYEWRAARAEDRLTLAGAVPTRAARAELVDYAGDLFPGGVDDAMIIARGAPDETAWLAVARQAVAQVAALEDGRATLRDERLTVEGRAPDGMTRDRVADALAYLPAPFLAAARVDTPEGGAAPVAAPAADVDLYAPIDDIAVCREVFASLGEGGRIEFARGEAAISKESYPLLDRLAIAAIRCEGMTVTITGGVGEADAGAVDAGLGLRRAQAVADYFILKGVRQDRLAAAGSEAGGAATQAVVFDINL